jgi:hypothetical protein
MGHPPAVRASDGERDAAVDRLRGAAAEGRLTLEEFAGRVGAALRASTRQELERLTTDLPEPQAASATRRGRRLVLGVLGGDDLRGRWRIGRRCLVVNVLGGADLDLRGALLEGPEVVVTVLSVLGGSDVLVSDDVEVSLTGFALIGANDLEGAASDPPPGAPVVRVRAFSLLGGTDVVVKRRRRR